MFAGAAATWLAATPGPGARADDARPASFTQAQADQGGDLYRASCASCHGPALNDGEFAPTLKGARFKGKWSGQSVGALFAYVSTNMPPGQAGALAPEDYANILAFLLQANGVPAGIKSLPADSQSLSDLSWPE